MYHILQSNDTMLAIVKDRVKRLMIPFVVALLLVVFPLTYAMHARFGLFKVYAPAWMEEPQLLPIWQYFWLFLTTGYTYVNVHSFH